MAQEAHPVTVEGDRLLTWWTAATDWRNWRLPVKLAAVLVVPVVVAVGAGVLQISGFVQQANSYGAVQRVDALRGTLIPLLATVQEERTLSAQRSDTGVVDPTRFERQAAATDGAVSAMKQSAELVNGLGSVASSRYRDALIQVGGLAQLRDEVRADAIDAPMGTAAYTGVVKALLDLHQALVGQLGDPKLSGTAIAVHDLVVAVEQVRAQQAVLLVGIGRGSLLGAEIRLIDESGVRLQDRLNDFRTIATPGQQRVFDEKVQVSELDARTQLVQVAVTQPAEADKPAGNSRRAKPPTFPISADDWNRASDIVAKPISDVVSELGDEVAATAARLQDDTSNKAGAASVVVLVTLLTAFALATVVGRYLLRSLGTLRRAALDVAQHRLPALVEGLRGDRDPHVRIEPVPVHTKEEFGQLARAFDAVHEQAVRSATEQAVLRANMRNTFVNLSRRSQSLVERQLKLMEELERNEEDSEQLANLFKLDHLATRMRRNNENLMVLSGSEVSRRFSKPVPLADVLRAAASEIEQYQRVVVRSAPPVEVVGYAASDLVRLIAELLDNAAAFSPPQSEVVIGARGGTDGTIQIEVVDDGIGMSDEELAEANERLAEEVDSEVPVSRQMGLFVVGRLAGRHGIDVRLRPVGEDRRGLRTTVLVPADLVRRPNAAPVNRPPVASPTIRMPAPAPSRPTAPPRTPPAAPQPVQEPATGQDGWSSFRGTSIEDTAEPALPWFGDSERADAAPAAPAQSPAHVAGSMSTWFDRSARGVRPAAPAASREETSAGLPKRNPRGNLLPNLADRPAAPPTAPPKRDPGAARGFLASYQSGVRQAVGNPTENGDGRERS
jgi:signal transduction histidine kinase